MLRSDKILQQITALCRRQFETGKVKIEKVLVSPYHPIVVVETSGHSAYINEKHRLETASVQIHHHYCVEAKGLKDLWEQYIQYRGID